MWKAYLIIEMECTGKTAEEAERNVLEECSYRIEITNSDIEEVDSAVTTPTQNFNAMRLDDKYGNGCPADYEG